MRHRFLSRLAVCGILLGVCAKSFAADSMPPELRKLQAESEERLKKDPELYRKVKAMRERAENTLAILAAYRDGKISRAAAEQRLAPLVREDAQAELPGLQERIRRMESELDFLRKASKDPELLVRRRIDRMLEPSGSRKGPPEVLDASGGM